MPYFMVLVIPAGKSAKQGKWWLETTTEPRRPSKVPAAIRIASAQKMEDNFAKADWYQLPRLVSLSISVSMISVIICTGPKLLWMPDKPPENIFCSSICSHVISFRH